LAVKPKASSTSFSVPTTLPTIFGLLKHSINSGAPAKTVGSFGNPTATIVTPGRKKLGAVAYPSFVVAVISTPCAPYMVILIISAVMSLVVVKSIKASVLAEISLLVTAVDSDYPHARCFGVLHVKGAEAAAAARQHDSLAWFNGATLACCVSGHQI
jgi:hypothetical protein